MVNFNQSKNNVIKQKVVVYTALAGAYDYLRPVPKGLDVIDFICFTNDSSKTSQHLKGWKLYSLPDTSSDARMSCRIIKANPALFFPDYDVSVWLDANISFTSELMISIESFIASGNLIQAPKHPFRNCAYDEANQCLLSGKDERQNIERTIQYLADNAYPKKHGLTETNVLFRKHNDPRIREAMRHWSELLKNYSKRDQLSFDFACWQHNIKVSQLESTVHGDNKVFRRGLHRSASKLRNGFAYIEALQGRFPVIKNIVNLAYSIKDLLKSQQSNSKK